MPTISGMHIEITELMPELSGVKDVTLKVGVMDGATNKDGESVAFYASKNEFGTTRIPKRPALRTTLDNGAQKYVNFIASQLKGGGRSLPDIMTILGARIQGDIVIAISNWQNPPNAPSTVARKLKLYNVGNKPLYMTGAYAKSITYRVDEGGGE